MGYVGSVLLFEIVFWITVGNVLLKHSFSNGLFLQNGEKREGLGKQL